MEVITKNKSSISSRITYIVLSIVISTLLILGTILSSSRTSASDTGVVDETVVTVPVVCSMGGVGGDSHNATMPNGSYSGDSGSEYENGIGTTTLTTFCNDDNGFSIYAIGYTGNNYGNNTLVGASSGQTINTKVYESTDTVSNWSMKVNKITDPSVAYNPENMSIDNSFNNWHIVPNDYLRVAHYKATTGSSTTDRTLGGKVTTTYAAYIDTTQAADTYEGQVKYVMVHPYDSTDANAPIIPSTLDVIAADTSNTYYMQDGVDCTNSTVGTVATLTDNRDDQTYKVAKAADGQCWMIENLKIGKTLNSTTNTSITLNPDDSNITGSFTLNYSDIPPDGKFHAYTIDGVPDQNNSNEWICRADWDSCYYNWYTATAGAGTTATTSGSVETSICPAGWTLPTSGSSGQFQALYNQYPSAALMEVDDPTTTKNNSAGKIPGFLLSGRYNTGGAGSLSAYGYYWSRTADDAQDAYLLYVYTSGVNPANYGHKYYGFAVRCLLSS